MAVNLEAGGVHIAVDQVVGLAPVRGLRHQAAEAVEGFQLFLFQALTGVDIGVEALEGRHGDLVEDGGAVVLGIGGSLSNFFSKIQHKGSPVQEEGDEQGRVGLRHTRFVVVLKEVEHPGLQVLKELPVPGYLAGVASAFHKVLEDIVEAGLVVQEVEANVVYVSAVSFTGIDFGNEDKLGILALHLGNEPFHILRRHHFHHIAAEAVNALGGPEKQDVAHLLPVGAAAVVHLEGVGPVVVIVAVSLYGAVGVGVVRGDVVGDIVYYHAKALVVGALYKGLEVLHTGIGIGTQVGVDVVIVADGVGGAGVALDIGLAGGMAYDPGVPRVSHSKGLKVLKTLIVNLLQCAVSPQAGEHLVYDHLRLNSERVTAVATATLSDSAVGAPPLKDGMNNLPSTSLPTSGLMPLDSLPITMRPSLESG